MKKLLLFTTLILSGNFLYAQPWMPSVPGPVKLQDVILNYTRHPDSHDEEQVGGGEEREGKDYLFDRWAWFWRSHLDTNGYMVSPVKTYQAWEDYQKIHHEKSSARTTSAAVMSDWVFEGPNHSSGGYSGLGRINVIAFHPTDANTLYVGSAGGGTWKSTDNGTTWNALYNALPNMGVSDIKINPLNANTIYVCTGDADGYDEYSIGVIKSTDGGATWANTGLTWSSSTYMFARSLIINPIDTNVLTLATSVGMYRSTDAGATWTNILGGDFKQLLYKPNDTNVVYATDYESASSQILRSADGGSTWTTVTSFTSATRINLAVCPANPAIVKAVAGNSDGGLVGIYGSTDTGHTYTALFINDASSCTGNLLGYELGLPTSQCNGQAWYDMCIAIDPSNPEHVIVGGINNYSSDNGGITWALATQWYSSMPGIATVHADKHFLAYNPNMPGALYQGCDGGIYESIDAASLLWTDITNGIGVTEFYRNAVAAGDTFCIGGAQDNGTKLVSSGGVAQDLTGGDGMTCQIDYINPATTWYTSFPGGDFDMTTDGGISYGAITNVGAGNPDNLGGDWVTPMIIHPVANNVLLLGYSKIYLSSDMGSSWSPISPVFTTGVNINSISVPYGNGNYIYASSDNNAIHFSPDLGVTWHNTNVPFSGNISRIIADPKNPDLLWVTFSGYGANKVAGYNHTTATWTHYNGTLPDVPVNCITIDSATGTKYIGTDVAVFYRDTAMADWALFNTNLPAVIVNDLNINYGTGELWAATFGRGMWKTQKFMDSTSADTIAAGVAQLVPYANDVINISPNPNYGRFTISTTNKMLIGQQISVRLLDGAGRSVWQQNDAFDNSGNLKVITRNLARGTYICELTNKSITARCKIVIY
jgi:photosystem II stability/assembly factor-like uncharacterized protein